jgi:arylsulfatase A-like enzyme
MIRSVDILPTILDSLDVTPLRDDLDGTSLLPQLEQGKGEFPRYAFSCTTNYEIFSEIGKKSDESEPAYSGFSVTRKDGWKFIFDPDTRDKKLFDIASDPNEENNLVDTRTDLADELQSNLESEFEERLSSDDGTSNEVRERLKDLGYL